MYRIRTVPLTFEPIAKGQISLCRSDSPPLYGLFNKLSSWLSTAARLLLPETNSSSKIGYLVFSAERNIGEVVTEKRREVRQQ